MPGLQAVCQLGSEVGFTRRLPGFLYMVSACFLESGQCEPLGTLERVRSIWGDFKATLLCTPMHFAASENFRAEKKSLSKLNMTTCFWRPLLHCGR